MEIASLLIFLGCFIYCFIISEKREYDLMKRVHELKMIIGVNNNIISSINEMNKDYEKEIKELKIEIDLRKDHAAILEERLEELKLKVRHG